MAANAIAAMRAMRDRIGFEGRPLPISNTIHTSAGAPTNTLSEAMSRVMKMGGIGMPTKAFGTKAATYIAVATRNTYAGG